MRLLILTQYYPPEIGAAQTRLAAFAKALSRRGVEVDVVTAMPHHLLGRVYPSHRRRIFTRERIDGIPVRRTWVYAATGTGLRRIFNYASFMLSCLVGLFSVPRPAFVIVESPPLFLVLPALLYAFVRRTKLILNVSDLWPDAIRQVGIYRPNHPFLVVTGAIEKLAYRACAFVTAITTGMLDALRREKHVPARKLLFLPNGVDTELFRPRPPSDDLRRSLGVGPGRHLFIYAGSHGKVHGLDTLVRAAALLAAEPIVLAFIGDGYTKASIRQLAADLRLENVRFVDPQPLEAMPDYFSSATASIVPMIRSDFALGARPAKLFPSFAAGVPVVFSAEGEAADLVRDNDVGIVVAPESPAELAAAMVRLCDDAVRQRMSVNARRLAEREFDWNRIVEVWLTELRRRTAAVPSAASR